MRMDSRRIAAGPIALALLAVAAVQIHAQAQSGTLEITVRGVDGAPPLAGAQVSIEGVGFRGVTDAQGFLRVTEVPNGARTLEVRFLGYEPLDERVTFTAGRVTRIIAELEIRPISLATVRVEARTSRLEETGFNHRARIGGGSFFTRAEIEKIGPRHMSDVLRRVTGVQLSPHPLGNNSMPIIRMRNAPCPVDYFVDGIPMAPGYHIDFLHPGVVEGVEIYRGAATIPIAFNRGNVTCGLIVVWTRVHR